LNIVQMTKLDYNEKKNIKLFSRDSIKQHIENTALLKIPEVRSKLFLLIKCYSEHYLVIRSLTIQVGTNHRSILCKL